MGKSYKTLTIRYILIEAETSYNVIIRRKIVNRIGVVVYTPHMAMKFPIEEGTIIIVKANPKEVRLCYIQSLKVAPYSVKGTTKEYTT